MAYAIGHPYPTSVHVDTFGTGQLSDSQIAEIVQQVFSFKPADIVEQLDLLRPIYRGPRIMVILRKVTCHGKPVAESRLCALPQNPIKLNN